MEQVILKTNHLTKRYGHRAVVENLSMTIHQGDIYGFIGKNEAGKTTLIRMVTGLAAPSDGSTTLLMAVLISLFVGSEFSNGTVKIIASRNYSRLKIDLSKLLVGILTSVLFTLVFVLAANICFLLVPALAGAGSFRKRDIK